MLRGAGAGEARLATLQAGGLEPEKWCGDRTRLARLRRGGRRQNARVSGDVGRAAGMQENAGTTSRPGSARFVFGAPAGHQENGA